MQFSKILASAVVAAVVGASGITFAQSTTPPVQKNVNETPGPKGDADNAAMAKGARRGTNTDTGMSTSTSSPDRSMANDTTAMRTERRARASRN